MMVLEEVGEGALANQEGSVLRMTPTRDAWKGESNLRQTGEARILGGMLCHT
jgi:hypothetical protein